MRFDLVKVFSATKARERGSLGERVTEFIRDKENKDLQVVDTHVLQSSDQEFHCLSIVVFFQKRS